jgi:biopolymer transport protein ExbD
MQLRPHKKRSSVVINVTSLIDVMFNLVLFFIVSTTFLTTPAIKLELPKAKHGEVITQQPIVIYIDTVGDIYFNDEPVDVALLGAALSQKLAETDDKSVVLKADARVTHGRVVEVMDVIKGAGATRLVVATEPPK